tara:strand:- start:8187 stop:8345 length:159 start_codon:yes stop_codon:yes gene_type:complete
MSWKIRRAQYYSRQKYGGVDPEGAKFWNLIHKITLEAAEKGGRYKFHGNYKH